MLTQVGESETTSPRAKHKEESRGVLNFARKKGESVMILPNKGRRGVGRTWLWPLAIAALVGLAGPGEAQTPKSSSAAEGRAAQPEKPRLVVLIVVDQMRADYVDNFLGQWTGGLKRLVEEGAWFRTAAYPYASTETCVGHATISTGAFPANHGIVANTWWDRDAQKMVTCTNDPNVKNTAYAGRTSKGGDSASQMLFPSYAEELKFQTGGRTRVVTFSLKARAAIMLAGHKADAVTWFDTATGAWVTSTPYQTMPFIEDYVEQHPMTADYGKTWSLSLPKDRYKYDENALGAAAVPGWGSNFPFLLHGKEGSSGPDETFFQQWFSSPFADTYLTKLAETAVDALELGRQSTTDYLGIGYSSTDSVGHTFGPQSWEVQDMLSRLDHDLGELFEHLDQKVGRQNYLVVLTADHGVAPIPAAMAKSGFDAGELSLRALEERLEKSLEPFHFGKPAISRIVGNEVYFAPGIYPQLQRDPAAMKTLRDTALATPGVAQVFTSEELGSAQKTTSVVRTAAELSYFASRSGDMYVLQKPYWLTDASASGVRQTGTTHGSPYYYDQRVPILLMGFGIRPGAYFEPATPADIAPTLGALTGVTLATHDGRVLREAFPSPMPK
jgi:predicted AlkP superfamily pyrophosphatase or phosphodiesterase